MLRASSGPARRRGDAPIGAVSAIGLVVIAAAAYIGFALAPVWFDYLAVKEICRTVVLDWVNHDSLAQAKARFNAELKRKNVSTDIEERHCNFVDRSGAWEVDCSWVQVAYYPGTDYFKTFPLRVHVAYVDGDARYQQH